MQIAKTSRRSGASVSVAKWSCICWLSLVVLGIILAVIGFENHGQSKEQPFGGLFAIFGDIQINLPEQFLVLLGTALLALNLAWVVSIIAAIASMIGLRSSPRREPLIAVMVISLLYVVLGASFWIIVLQD